MAAPGVARTALGSLLAGSDAPVKRTVFVVPLLLGCALAADARAQDGLPPPAPTTRSEPRSPVVDRVAVAKRFYDAFTSGDMTTLESLYDPKVKWSDPILSFDDREGTMGMWRWESSQSPRFTYEIVPPTAGTPHDQVQVRWHADYHLNGNPIHNDVLATLTIDDAGKVVAHRDDYSWEKWAAQAFPGLAHSPVWPHIEGVVRLGVAGLLRLNSWKENHKAPLITLPCVPDCFGAVGRLGAALGEK
jgi:hypothetical protein